MTELYLVPDKGTAEKTSAPEQPSRSTYIKRGLGAAAAGAAIGLGALLAATGGEPEKVDTTRYEYRALPGDTESEIAQKLAEQSSDAGIEVSPQIIQEHLEPAPTLDDKIHQDPTDDIVQIGERFVAEVPTSEIRLGE